MRRIFIATTLLLVGLLSLSATFLSVAQPSGSLDPEKSISQYLLDVWTTEEGLPQNSINSITQSHDGYLWLGTQEGLVRFDGTRLQVFNRRNNTLNNNNVVTLFDDQDGNLWIGTLGGGLTLYNSGRFTSYTSEDGLSSDYITAVLQDRTGSYWIGTSDAGITRLTNNQISYLSSTDGLGSNSISALHEDHEGNIWIGTLGGGLTRYQDGYLTTFTTQEGLSSPDVTSIIQDVEGTLWIGTRAGGLNAYSNRKFLAYTTKDGLPSNDILSVLVDDAGSIWIGTDHGGLSRLFDGKFTTFSTNDGLAYDIVRSLYQDREGNLWIGTDGGGLNRLRNGIFTSYTTNEGLAHNFTYAIFEDADGSLWIGTDAGVSRLSGDRFTTFTTRNGLSSNFILSVYGTRDGSLWFGTYGAGLNRYQNGRFSTYTIKDGLLSDEIYALFEDSEEVLWIGTRYGLSRYREGQFNTFTTEHGLSSHDITSIAEDNAGRIWAGTFDGGLNVIENDQVVQQYDTDDGLLSNFVLTVYADQEGDVWIGTRDGGLNRYRDGLFTSFTPENGLYDDNVFQLLEDQRGNLWMSCNVGLFRVSKQELNDFANGDKDTFVSIEYNQSDGLRSVEFNGGFQPAGWRSRDGRLWFPSNEGIVVIDPDSGSKNLEPPQIIVERVVADEQVVDLNGAIRLSPGTNKLEFNYVGLTFLAPEKVQYRYQLEGVDEDWVVAGTRREAYYTNLDPGHYTFKVVAGDSDGNWPRKAATVSFYLKSFFYQRPLFQLFGFLCLILLTFLIYRLRIRHLKAHRRELLELVDQNMSTLLEEKVKTEQALRETEKARQESERQKEIAQNARSVIEEQASQLRELDRIKTTFFNNISHEFRTPLTLLIGPLENALTGVYGPANEKMRKQLELMLRNARRLLRLINQLLDLSKLESGKLELNVREHNIVPLLEGVVLSFTAFAEKKNLLLNFTPSSEKVILNYDAASLEKVFFNLLSNAVKFTPAGGKILVSIKEPKAMFSGTHTTVEIRVKDTGIGIPTKELPHIFDRFHQVDGAISHSGEGTGIGLSLVQELVALHEGTIKVLSEPGKGSEFIVTFPKGLERMHPGDISEPWSKQQAPDISCGPMMEMAVFDDDESAEGDGYAGEAPHAPEYELERRTLLVVDDNADVRDYVSASLDATYHVITAKDGRDALEKVSQFLPDLIISDVMMPIMDGYTLCSKLKSHPRLKYIPIILLTARAAHEDRIQGFEAGADDYMPKPFSAREMSVRIKKLLATREQRYELEDLNEELTCENLELREESEQKSELLRIAAHDMKNPLNAIREFAQIIKKELGEDSEVFDPADIIHQSSDQMLHMVTSLLDSEAIEKGLITLNFKPVNINTLAAAIVRRNKHQAEKKGQQLILSISEERCLIEADKDRLFDALDNLVSNAIKYSPKNKAIRVNVRRNRSTIQFEVKDEGPGLTAEDRQNLFKKFQRLSAQPTGGESSSGLGLSIVKQIVELHNGKVWADSKSGEGSSFIIALPTLKGDSKPNPIEEKGQSTTVSL